MTIALYFTFEDSDFLNYLNQNKDIAIKQNEPLSMRVPIFGANQRMDLLPHGVAGFTYQFVGNELSIKMGRWTKKLKRPNAMITVRSETLWRMSVKEITEKIKHYFEFNGAMDIEMKISRIDMCVDVLMPNEDWNIGLVEQAVTKATSNSAYYIHRKLSGLSWGKGDLMCRMYDKPLEIRQKSKKEWMYKIWGLKEVPEGYKIIRIEFQVRREVFKEMKIDTVEDFMDRYKNVWAYLTKKWFQMKDNPGKHQTNQRKTTKLWEKVQDGFNTMKTDPAIRNKAIKVDEKQLYQQAYGMLSSLNALKAAMDDSDKVGSFDQAIKYLKRINNEYDIDFEIFAKRAEDKRSKYHRALLIN